MPYTDEMTDQVSQSNTAEPTPAVSTLGSRIPAGGTKDPDAILDLFLGWVADTGFELYPAQDRKSVV